MRNQYSYFLANSIHTPVIPVVKLNHHFPPPNKSKQEKILLLYFWFVLFCISNVHTGNFFAYPDAAFDPSKTIYQH